MRPAVSWLISWRVENQARPSVLAWTASKWFKRGRLNWREYILFDRFNDSIEDADHLIDLCRKVPAFVNIIEYNNVEGVTLRKAKSDRRDAFVAHLRNAGVNAAIRRSRGKDIDAACGQLANKLEN